MKIMGENNHRLTSENLVNSMPERIFEVMVQRQNTNGYVCFIYFVFLLYLCTTENHENTNIDEKEMINSKKYTNV